LIACILIPAFELRAALRARPRLALVPAALAPAPGKAQIVGAVTATAEAAGVAPGMRLSEALATCPGLVLVEPDPAAVEQEWEALLRRLEDAGIAVEPGEPGVVTFETAGVERLYGGVEAALTRALASVGPAWDPRAGAGHRRFVALAAASVARPGQVVIVEGKEESAFLEPLPLSLLPLEAARYAELEGLGVRRLGELVRLPGAAVAERLGPEGKQAWSLAHGGGGDGDGQIVGGVHQKRVRGRSPAAELVEALSFPEAVANEITLRRAFAALLDRLLGRPERAGRPFRKIAVSAKLVGGGSWRRTATLRDATADRGRLRSALAAKLVEIPAPVVELRLEAVELAEHTGQQLALVDVQAGGGKSAEEADARLREGLRQVRASAGAGAVCAVVEVAPWSRIPEARAIVVPRDV
jgi:nucleotidyltransferase/DNA polymerase involved in DNA repair